MGRIRILPYKQGSRSAKALAEALGAKVLKLEGSTYKYRDGDTLINWGNSQPSGYNWGATPLNPAYKIAKSSNKLTFFQQFNNTDCLPQFWTNKEDIPNEAFPIVCRTILSGHSGAGIHIAASVSDLVDAPLFVKYEKKKEEYRVHLGRLPDGSTTVISEQRKARRLDHDSPNWQVRNHANGFVYVRDGVSIPEQVLTAAILVFNATGLDFGAVDVIWNESKEKALVLEINTAPGLEGTTVTDYAEFFRGA